MDEPSLICYVSECSVPRDSRNLRQNLNLTVNAAYFGLQWLTLADTQTGLRALKLGCTFGADERATKQ